MQVTAHCDKVAILTQVLRNHNFQEHDVHDGILAFIKVQEIRQNASTNPIATLYQKLLDTRDENS